MLKFLLFQGHLKFTLGVHRFVKTGNKLNRVRYQIEHHQGTASDAKSDRLETARSYTKLPAKRTEVQLQL
jgi:hypothetical protein